MLQKLSPLEKCKEELGSVKAELEEKKVILYSLLAHTGVGWDCSGLPCLFVWHLIGAMFGLATTSTVEKFPITLFLKV